jgi:hypothetical protein
VAALRRLAVAAIAGAATAAIVVVLTRGSSPPPARTAPPTAATAAIQFGANVGPLFNGAPYGAGLVNRQLAALAATGATLARADAPWEATEPSPPVNGGHHYDWAFDDQVATDLAEHGLRWLPILDYSAPWAQSVPGQDHSPPRSPADYAAYAAAVAARYGQQGSFWRSHPGLRAEPIDVYEIWNEPDSGLFWYPHPDLRRYASLYLEARAAIRAVQPAARVIVGGLAHPVASIPALIAADPSLGGQLDGVAIHPYGADPGAVVATVRDSRAALDAAGLGAVPLYVTEFGWTTSPPGALDYAPAPRRPAFIEQTLADLGHLSCGLAAVLLFAWTTSERDPANPNDQFGIAAPGGGGGPGVQAFTAGLRAAVAPAPALGCG